ncbi:class I SAM-dependent methyltransferase [Aquipuribacter sp. SD81]|uniref:class I SAM-dependent methyltransferase n=1 Tax=Aquipuribacter sp. SD81 TaxID=3127703 RepID=UPI003018FE24
MTAADEGTGAAGLAALLRPDGWALLGALPPYDPDRALALGERLRADGVPAETVAAALTQSRLRAAARAKLGGFADGMLFTADGLEQATRLPVAARHADRLRAAGATRVADLGCGIGVDALAVAGMDLAVDAVERDEATAAVATVNLRHFPRARVHLGDATGFPDALPLARPGTTDGVDAVWTDPARRAGGRRVTDPERWSPPLSWALGLPGTGVRAVGAKVAPGVDHDLVAADGPAAGWTAAWTSVDGDVVEAVLWWGAAAVPGTRRTATVLRTVERDGATQVQEVGTLSDAGLPQAPVGDVGEVLLEPDGAVIRAGLVGHVAAEVGGRLIDPSIAYVTTDEAVSHPLARAYEVRAVLPWGLKRLRAHLREQGVGRVTVKRRGSPLDPEELRRALRLSGDGEATVVLTRRAGERVVLVCDPLG